MKRQFREQAERIVRKSGISFPFPDDLDFSSMPPIQFIDRYNIDYLHSLGQDSPFFLGLKHRKLLGSWCKACDYRYATPKGSCMCCGGRTEWFELPETGTVHAFTVCYFGSEKFLAQTPFVLVLVEFEGVDLPFLSRMKEVDVNSPSLEWIGMKVRVRFAKNVAMEGRAPSVADVWFVPDSRKT